ncbi:MAG: hypothetical protein HY226_05340 [Candidatus Vogelbacteria bacterium]|nr:hypothetical protein [Candidatus Vogelbacteria bacterium]
MTRSRQRQASEERMITMFRTKNTGTAASNNESNSIEFSFESKFDHDYSKRGYRRIWDSEPASLGASEFDPFTFSPPSEQTTGEDMLVWLAPIVWLETRGVVRS